MRKLVGWGAAALAVIAAAVGVLGTEYSWHWGDVPTWVGAVATTFALAAAALAARGAYQQLAELKRQATAQDNTLKLQKELADADRKEAKERAEEKMRLLRIEARRQAEQIDVRPKLRAVVLKGTVFNNLLAVRIGNDSPRPIRNVACRLDMKPYSFAPYGHCGGDYESGATPIDQTPIPPLPLIRRDESVALIFPVLETGNAGKAFAPTHVMWAREADNRIAEDIHPGQGMISPVIAYMVRFTDDADQHWELTDDMHLKQIDDRSDW